MSNYLCLNLPLVICSLFSMFSFLPYFSSSSPFLTPLAQPHLSSDNSKPAPLGPCGGHKVVEHRERETDFVQNKNKINVFHTEKEKIVMPVQIFVWMFFSAACMPIIQSKTHAALTFSD